MKFLIQIILVAILTYLGQLIGPWWMVFAAAGLAGILVRNKGVSVFFAGFLGVAILWFVQTLLIDRANESILSTRIAELFTLNSPMLLILITALIGGLCGGFGALTSERCSTPVELAMIRRLEYDGPPPFLSWLSRAGC